MSEMAQMRRILVTGAVGQIGSELTLELRQRYGPKNVLATGNKTKPDTTLLQTGPFEFIDITRCDLLEDVVDRYKVDTVYNMAAILSAAGEEKPDLAWHVDVTASTTSSRSHGRVGWCASSAQVLLLSLGRGPHDRARPRIPHCAQQPCMGSPRSRVSCCASTMCSALVSTFAVYAIQA